MKRRLFLVALLFAMVITLAFGTAFAADETTFFISLKHNVKGDEIDLTREAPFLIQVSRDGQVWTYIHMQFHQRVDTYLPGGVYDMAFIDTQTGDTVFECGPYDFENGDDIRLQFHEQGAGREPRCYVKD